MTTSDNSQTDLFRVHRKVIHGLWHARWWLLLVAGLLAIITVYTIPISNQEIDVPAMADHWLRLKLALLFALLALQLTAWFISILKALSMHQMRWVVLLLIIPPAAFAYLIRYH
ncbi:MAG: hypothetical protein JAZ20_06430 [Candidatus Thiodiazotropha weberae]|nr:hypothetical protein [Candidatus Thiodiazotropha lotti]MCG7989482.1 hypothetical protein [Candidatus Thiodiazotropha lotti]MCG8010265.1 hypothetical protein [Candidatus Thiodiazotropha lotti]MCG8020036.1 hypothetical protein [Candidatus Thiodiazotropha lotti]MCW4207198.1 hypothetical protein [Candidatus Thiodiazotropha lotti]